MALNETIAPQLHDIGERIKRAKRDDPKDRSISGWGQFLDVEDHKEQIGPYGTCSAVLFDEIMNPGAAVEDEVVAQVERFWDDPNENRKLRSQNVRIAFLVLALAGTDNKTLARIRDEAVAILEQRQRPDGAWGDWAAAETSSPPRQETTAWILLALHRAGVATGTISKAQEYLLRFVGPPSNRSSISDFATAALLETLDKGKAPRKLLSRAMKSLKKFDDGLSERISFFDYLEISDGNEPPILRRDYLCYPALLPFAFLTSGITKHANLFGHLIAARSRLALSQSLEEMVGAGQYYLLPGAARASTVDQAAIALAFECLRKSEFFFDQKLAALRPIFSWIRRSIIFRLIIPIAAAIVALLAIQNPLLLLWLAPSWSWIDKNAIALFITTNENAIRIAAGIYLFFANSTPGRVFTYIKERWWQ